MPPKIFVSASNLYKFLLASCRQVEFARAALEQVLDAPNSGTSFKYVGMVREDKVSEIRSAIESQVYEKWEARRGSFIFLTQIDGHTLMLTFNLFLCLMLATLRTRIEIFHLLQRDRNQPQQIPVQRPWA